MDLARSLSHRLARIASPTSGTGSKQLYFAALLVGFTALVSISRPELVLTAQYLTALGVLALATVLALAIQWEARRPAWGAVVPVLDMGAVALARDAARDHTIAISLLMLVPTLWIAARLRRNGVLIAVASTSVLIALPSLMRTSHIDSLAVAHSLLLPFIVLQIGMLTVGALALMDERNRQLTEALAEQESLLEAAAASERLLENVIDSVDVGIVVVDREGHDVLMNRAQRRIHHLASPPGNDDPNESQLLLRHPGSALPMPPEQRPVRRAVLQETFTNSLVAMGPLQREASVFSASARQVIDHRGERSGAVVVFSDVTSYIETVRSQERFVASVSHELRTPLTSVIGYLELAQDDVDLSRETASYLQVAQRNADQLLLIVQDLLADQVARSGTEQLTLRPARLSEIAQQAAESVALRAQQRGITLERRIVETPELPLDAQRLQQAVGNLLSNALKYTSRGGTVCVHTAVEDHHLELAVTDTGIGMSDQEQTNLFTDYYRTETARNSDIPGHGIGLSLTRRIVVAHGGQISVSSRPGEGSTFTIRFGLDEVEWADRA